MSSSSFASESALYSLWLVPDAPIREKLEADIQHLTSASGTAAFVPHITLAGDLSGDPGDITEIAQKIATQAAPVQLSVTGVVQGDQFFKSLFLRLDLSPQIAHLRAQCQVLGTAIDQASFDPHVSLAYGHIPEQKLHEPMQALRHWLGTSLAISALSLVRSSSEIPIQNWEILRHFPLIGRG